MAKNFNCFDYISTLVAVMTTTGEITFVNKYILTHTGKKLESFLGKKFHDFGSTDVDKKNMKFFLHKLNGLADISSEKLITKSTVKNKKYWIEWEADIAFDENHKLYVITGKVLSEYMEKRFKHINDPVIYAISQGLEKAPFIVMISDDTWNIRYVNEQFEKSTGFEYNEVLGKKPVEIIADMKVDKDHFNIIDRKLEEKGKWTGELYNVKKSGEAYIEYGSILSINGINGNNRYFLKVTFDFSQKLNMEIKLKEMFKKSEAIMEILPDPVFIINRSGKYIDYIAKPHEKLALNRNTIIGKTIFDTEMNSEDMKKTMDVITASLNTQKSTFYEYSLPADKGGKYYYEGWVVPLNSNEVLFLARDITLDKEHKKYLKEAKEAAEMSDRAKSKFLANTNHELRTPLTVILGAAETLMSLELTKEQLGFVETIRNFGKSLLLMINNIIDVTKIESGIKTFEEEPFNIRTLIEYLITGLKLKAEKKGLCLEYNISENLPTIVIGDQTYLKQIIFNLVGNAIKFTDTGYVKMDIITKYMDEQDILIEINVEDTGIGIEEENYDKIFEPFSQADPSIHKKYGGTGLGLTIAKRIVDEINGKIEINSIKDKGSTFKVVLPLKNMQ